MDLIELLKELKTLMERVARTDGLDLESCEFMPKGQGNRWMQLSIHEWAEANVEVIEGIIWDDAVEGFVAAD